MMPGANMKIDTDIRLPLSFILYGLLALVISQVILFVSNDALLTGHFRIPDIWMGAHFLLLGYAVMVAMGAMYQLVPVAFLTPIWSQKFGFVQLGITVIGVTAFAILLGVNPDKAIFGGIIAIAGILMFIFQMVMSIWNQEKKTMMTYFVIGAIACFFLTIIAGFLLAWNISVGGIGNHNTILSTHILLGVAGWFTLLIFGFSYKLVPMFSLSHGFSMKWAKPALLTYVIGLIVLISSFWSSREIGQTIGWGLLFFGFGFFCLDIKDILSKRVKKKLDKSFSFALLAIINGLTIHALALIFRLVGMNDSIVWSWLIFLYIMGWIIFSILGYLNKIVPVLWWTYKYSEKIGKEKVPLLKDLINEKANIVLFSLFIISVVGLTLGALAQYGLVVVLFQGILTIASLLYTISIIRILFL
ncbi:hypothetical protein GMD78_19760 [Ornithinibacillus sp. L9]|uniref:Uncharacterized protein n=1 Tax=Ornithinibacillus caprae TaxID=2678566 RepID=A0A6N8FQH9_9BACI|nr:hypothetical protein [Ornithinibacillus caprae]MUK90597.1 hypothetical protein [Ornithinibacillus caprae]